MLLIRLAMVTAIAGALAVALGTLSAGANNMGTRGGSNQPRGTTSSWQKGQGQNIGAPDANKTPTGGGSPYVNSPTGGWGPGGGSGPGINFIPNFVIMGIGTPNTSPPSR
jgi:hypothetical protein